jgi:hypothetical protein
MDLKSLRAATLLFAACILPPNAYAAHDEPVGVQQLPSLLGGDCSMTAGSGMVVCGNVFGRTSQANAWGALQTMNGGADLRAAGTIAQAALGQLGMVTSPYTAAMLNTSQTALRVQVGGLDPTYELSGKFPTSYAISASLDIPAGSSTGSAGNPDSPIASYCRNNNSNKSCVGIYTLVGTSSSGNFMEGANVTAINSNMQKGLGNQGFDFQYLVGIEADIGIYCEGNYSTSGCPSNLSPSGLVYGYLSVMSGTSDTTGDSAAFSAEVSNITGAKQPRWKAAFSSITAAAFHGMLLGAQGATGPSQSQDIVMVSLKADGTPSFATIFEDVAGGFNINNTGNFLLAATFPQIVSEQTIVGPAGMRLVNDASGVGTSENLLLQTGGANSTSYAQFGLADAGLFSLTVGPAVTGFGVTAPQILLSGLVVHGPVTGGASASFGEEYIATTSGGANPTTSMAEDQLGNFNITNGGGLFQISASFPQLDFTQSIAGASGFRITNSDLTAGDAEYFLMAVGNANGYLTLTASNLTFATSSNNFIFNGAGGIFQVNAASEYFAGPLTLAGNTTTGTPTGSLCMTSTGVVITKPTANCF